jgi:hypothetical protein
MHEFMKVKQIFFNFKKNVAYCKIYKVIWNWGRTGRENLMPQIQSFITLYSNAKNSSYIYFDRSTWKSYYVISYDRISN